MVSLVGFVRKPRRRSHPASARKALALVANSLWSEAISLIVTPWQRLLVDHDFA